MNEKINDNRLGIAIRAVRAQRRNRTIDPTSDELKTVLDAAFAYLSIHRYCYKFLDAAYQIDDDGLENVTERAMNLWPIWKYYIPKEKDNER